MVVIRIGGAVVCAGSTVPQVPGGGQSGKSVVAEAVSVQSRVARSFPTHGGDIAIEAGSVSAVRLVVIQGLIEQRTGG